MQAIDIGPVQAELDRRGVRRGRNGFNGKHSTEPLPAFRLLTGDDLRQMPQARWAVRNLLPEQGLASMYGQSRAGKSFLMWDLVCAAAEARDWFGYRIRKPLRCCCVVLEGRDGFRQRVRAWETDNGRAMPDGVRLILDDFRLTEPAHVLGLAAAVQAAGGADLIVIDTLNRATPGIDENSAADMGRVIEQATELQRLTGGLVLLVAHVGKDTTRGLRGHSSLLAALDAAIEVTREGDARHWSVAKAKDAEDGAQHSFALRAVDLGDDDEGESVVSCVIERTGDKPAQVRVALPTGGNQRIVYDALLPLFRASVNFGRASAPPTRPCIPLADAISSTRDRLAVDSKRRTERAQQAITGLVAKRVLCLEADWLWLP